MDITPSIRYFGWLRGLFLCPFFFFSSLLFYMALVFFPFIFILFIFYFYFTLNLFFFFIFFRYFFIGFENPYKYYLFPIPSGPGHSPSWTNLPFPSLRVVGGGTGVWSQGPPIARNYFFPSGGGFGGWGWRGKSDSEKGSGKRRG